MHEAQALDPILDLFVDAVDTIFVGDPNCVLNRLSRGAAMADDGDPFDAE